jgi:hypothetical protein
VHLGDCVLKLGDKLLHLLICLLGPCVTLLVVGCIVLFLLPLRRQSNGLVTFVLIQSDVLLDKLLKFFALCFLFFQIGLELADLLF